MASPVYMFQINMLLSLDYEQIRKLQIIYSFNAHSKVHIPVS